MQKRERNIYSVYIDKFKTLVKMPFSGPYWNAVQLRKYEIATTIISLKRKLDLT